MTSLILIPWARTNWSDEGRLAARTGLPVNDAGRQELRQWADQLRAEAITAVYGAPNETAAVTAKTLAKFLNAPCKTLDGLEEPSLGLWEGLTPAQLVHRFPKAYKQWRETPTAVCPPEGEDIQDATDRLMEVIHKLADKHADKAIGLVLGPVAKAIIRCDLENIDLERLWKKVDRQPACHRIDLAPESAPAAG